jgi:hypothetical protein
VLLPEEAAASSSPRRGPRTGSGSDNNDGVRRRLMRAPRHGTQPQNDGNEYISSSNGGA